ncbi:uncharacterized protein LOC122817786 [Drosophila biarmipes]|uniref:uncharacterized protein LOC122817786 n=1 Tax=Drosophila biarmipes TaxID=125945 RepID=UPI001CDAE0EF|nr:uncharacterized protein LOC122817786 [Drosophila biarmipes]
MDPAKVSNHGVISLRECQCRGRNDPQMMNTEHVTNYGIMTTRKCQGETNPQTLKLETFTNHGILVLHKCRCNSELLQIDELTNYGNVVICRSSCKLAKRNELKALEVPKSIGSMEEDVTAQKATGLPLELSASTSVHNTPEKNSLRENLTKSSEATCNTENLMCLSVPRKITDLPAITKSNPLKRTMTSTETVENQPKKLCLASANQYLDGSSKSTTSQKYLISLNDPLNHHTQPLEDPPKQLSLVLENQSSARDLGPLKIEVTTVEKPVPRSLVMCPPCAKDLQDYLNDPANADLKPKRTYLKCPYCLNFKANKREFGNHIATCQQEHKPYKCTGCAYKSTKKSSVTGHSATCFFVLSAKIYEQRCLSLHHFRN